MHSLRVRLLGSFHLACTCGAQDLKMRPTARAVLAYLLLHRNHIHRREVLAATFWGGESDEAARRHLSHTLWRIREALAASGGPHAEALVVATNEEVSLAPDLPLWLDVAVFEAAVAPMLGQPFQAASPEAITALEAALALYTADLLEGHYDDWVIRERERLSALHAGGLAWLMRYYRQQGPLERAIELARRLLELDPLAEEVHRELIQLYLANQQRGLAIQQYHACYAVLARELGLAPLPETQALYARITGSPAGLPGAGLTPPQTVRQALSVLDRAMLELDSARSQLRQALHHLDPRASAGPGEDGR